MALWSIWSAPLYMSNDLRKIDRRAREILTSAHLIAINQDKLGVFGLMVGERRTDDGDFYQVFAKPILPLRHECPSFALVYLNRNTLGGQVKVGSHTFALKTRSFSPSLLSARRTCGQSKRARELLNFRPI